MAKEHNTHTHTTVLQLCGICPGQPGWAGTRRNIHPLQSSWSSIIPICFLHLLQSTASSVFNPRALQSFSTISLQVFFGLPRDLAPSTSYSIHFFIQSLSSFRSTCPYHRSLFCCSTEIMSSNPSLSLSLSTLYLELHLVWYQTKDSISTVMYTSHHHRLACPAMNVDIPTSMLHAILHSMTGSFQTNVNWCQIWFNGPETGEVWSAWSVDPVPW